MSELHEYKYNSLIELLADISNMCIGDLAMGYRLDAQEVGQMIYEATGMTNTELNKRAKELKK